MITEHLIDQTYSDLKAIYGGVREDYFGLLYLEQEYNIPRSQAINQIAFGGNDYGIDGFHFDRDRRNIYLFQFKYSSSYGQFKVSLKRLIEDGMEQIFVSPNKDDAKNQILLQVRSCLVDNRSLIDQVCIHFVFTGDPSEAEHSKVLDKLREDLENKKYAIDVFFDARKVGLVVEFKSSSGKIGALSNPRNTTAFEFPMADLVEVSGPSDQKMHIGFIPLAELHRMHLELGPRFFDSNIRYGLGENEAVNRAISRTLRQIIIDQSESATTFAFNHNGITLFAEKVDWTDGLCRLTAPRLLNGAQTVTTVASFLSANKEHPNLSTGMQAFKDISVLCKVITAADQKFVTRVTINNNRQNPVEPWNLHANDLIQLELQDKLRSDLQIYYERQENAFNQLSIDDLSEYGIHEDSRAIQLLKLTQTFLLTDGLISKLSNIRQVFEDDRTYDNIFRQTRLNADSRHIVLCYKVERRLRKLSCEIEQKGQNKYAFIHRCRYLLWALICQGLLNDQDLAVLSENYGTSMSLPADYTSKLNYLATARVRLLLSELLQDNDYAEKVREDKLSFLRTDRAFEKCMAIAYSKWGWVHKKLQ